MTARVSREFSFDSGIHHDGSFMVNRYQLTLHLDIHTDNIRCQNIALERIKYIIEGCLENSVLVNEKCSDAISKFQEAGLKVCSLPDDPYDQVVAAILLRKLNAITEGKVEATEIVILSKICDGVNFFISADESHSFGIGTGKWWSENSPSICSHPKKEHTKIVEIRKESPTWVELGLTWEDQEVSNDNEIAFSPADKS